MEDGIKFLRLGTLCDLINISIGSSKINVKGKSGENITLTLGKGNEGAFDALVLLGGSILEREKCEKEEKGEDNDKDLCFDTLNMRPSKASYISPIINGKSDIDKRIKKIAVDLKPEQVEKYTTKYIYSNLKSEEQFFCSLEELIKGIPLTNYRENLMRYYKKNKLGFNINEFSDVDKEIIKRERKNLLAECICYVCRESNRIDDYYYNPKKYDLQNGDPHTIGKINVSTALSISIRFKKQPYNRTYKTSQFYHFETCIEYIIENNLVIKDIEVLPAQVLIDVEETNYKLKRLSSLEYSSAVKFLEKYKYEFKAKVSWKGFSIDQLVDCGLRKGKWLAYGYYDSDEIIAYLDYKFRVDKRIELGTIIIDDVYRKKGLATSLIYLFRLMFPTLRLTSGTYEENDGMIHTFEKTGFEENLYSDGTNLKKDRINPDYPLNDEENFTNSVYYYADELLKNVTNIDN